MKDTCNLAEFRGFRKIRQVVGVVTLFLALTLAGPLASLAAAPPTSVYLVSFDLNKTTLVRNGNDSITGTVTVGGVPAGYGWPVYLSSANGFVLMPSPGTGVTGNGNATVTSAPFSISPYVFGGTSPVTETITATVSGGNSISKAITINPIFPTLTLSPGTLTDGLGQTVTATLSTGVQVYDGAGTYSISTSSGAVSVPSPVTIPDGENSFQFQLSQGTAVSTATPVTVTATQHWPIYGANSASAAIMVRPAGAGTANPAEAGPCKDCLKRAGVLRVFEHVDKQCLSFAHCDRPRVSSQTPAGQLNWGPLLQGGKSHGHPERTSRVAGFAGKLPGGFGAHL